MSTSSAPFSDQTAREAIRSELDCNVVVEAAAGTGKTTELVRRIVSVLATGRSTVSSLVAVTFTEKAAGELKLRLREGLERARQETAQEDESRRAHLEDALARLEEAWVGTIHGFCSDLLRERSVEASVDPEFVTMTEPESFRVFRDAFDLWLQETLNDPPDGVRRSLRRISRWGNDDEGPVGRLRQAAWTLAAWRDFPAAWRRDEFDREGWIDSLVSQLRELRDILETSTNPERDYFYRDTEPARRLAEELERSEAVRDRDYDGLEARFSLLLDRNFRSPRKGRGQKFGEGVTRAEAHEAHARFCEALEMFNRAADADLASRLHAELREVIDRYEDSKRKSGQLDFVDLLIYTRDLLAGSREMREEFQHRFTHIFVDEFQDTDPLQAEILMLLASADPSADTWQFVDPTPGKLFLVGDPKQSIYRFRRADVGIYQQVKEILRRRGALVLQLTTNFRSVPALQHAVNRAFPALMDGDARAHQAEYVPLTPFREDAKDQPGVIALPVPQPYGYTRIAKSAIDGSLPDAVAAWVHWLLTESGWTVTDREHPDKRVPVQARHVCLLFRRFDNFFIGDVTRGYVQALEARGIRHLLVGGRSFHEREEVDTVRAALMAIEWPDDELSIFATLRGALFSVGDEELLEYRHHHGRLHPFRLPKDVVAENLRPVVESLRVLGDLHRSRNDRPVAETIASLLETTRAHAGFVLRPSGEQALANVLHVAEQARAYESQGGLSFRGFVQRLVDESSRRTAAEAPILEDGSDGVRLMTVHKAKGLEFPVVVLADITANIASARANRYVDSQRRFCAVRLAGWSPVELLEHQNEEVLRDVAEGIRVSYVAATRARDVLVVPGIGDERWGEGYWSRGAVVPEGEFELSSDQLPSWTAPLNAALYPERGRWTDSTAAAGCPPFGDDTTMRRPERLAFDVEWVKPGAHRMAEGKDAFDTVWWDPRSLQLDADYVYGVRNKDLMSKDVAEVLVERDRERFREWRKVKSAAVDSSSVPSVKLIRATERAATADSAALLDYVHDVEILRLDVDADRPGGTRFGVLMHAALATVVLDADTAAVDAAVRLQGRILGAPPEEVGAAVAAVDNALRHSLFDRVRAAQARDEVRRETPVTSREPDGSLVDGVIDLAFRDGDHWVVVDFKTDKELQENLAVYRRQIAYYASVVARATGLEARPVLMRI